MKKYKYKDITDEKYPKFKNETALINEPDIYIKDDESS